MFVVAGLHLMQGSMAAQPPVYLRCHTAMPDGLQKETIYAIRAGAPMRWHLWNALKGEWWGETYGNVTDQCTGNGRECSVSNMFYAMSDGSTKFGEEVVETFWPSKINRQTGEFTARYYRRGQGTVTLMGTCGKMEDPKTLKPKL